MESNNKDGDKIETPNLQKEKDIDFIYEFNVPEEYARECRLNFEENIDYINRCKKEYYLELLDKESEEDQKEFTIPFKM